MMLDYDNDDASLLLATICYEYGVSPFVPLESENFFRELLRSYSGNADPAAVESWLRHEVEQQFVALGARPRWIQSPEWPFANGTPMIFAGQIDISVHTDQSLSKFFHDDTSLYVFIGLKVAPVVITQQF